MYAESSFSLEVQSHLPRLRRRARQLTPCPYQADDLVQETIARALAFSHTFTPGTYLLAWLRRIQFTIFISELRRRGRERRAYERLMADPVEAPKEAPAPELLGLSKKLEAALEELPSPFEQVVRMIDLEEHSYREAALALAIPVGTVMSRLHRGRKLLALSIAGSSRPSGSEPSVVVSSRGPAPTGSSSAAGGDEPSRSVGRRSIGTEVRVSSLEAA